MASRLKITYGAGRSSDEAIFEIFWKGVGGVEECGKRNALFYDH